MKDVQGAKVTPVAEVGNTDAAREAQIQAKGLNAPRLTPALIDSKIANAQYHVPAGTTLTVCTLTLTNGSP